MPAEREPHSVAAPALPGSARSASDGLRHRGPGGRTGHCDRLRPAPSGGNVVTDRRPELGQHTHFINRCAPADAGSVAGSVRIGHDDFPSRVNDVRPLCDRIVGGPGAPAEVAASFEEATRGLGVVGVAYAVVGRGGLIRTLGTWRTGPAWSTSKVPVAIAAGRHPTGETQQLIQAALTRSDNAAAEALWANLGGGETAAALVDDQLRRLGDDETRVQASRVRPPFTPFGQTMWSLEAQVRVAAALSCSPDRTDRAILATMGKVVPEQHWGLGRFDGAAFKGGWGPNPAGRYLVRQFGLIKLNGVTLAVAMAVEPSSGSFASGTTALGVVTWWLAQSGLPGTVPVPGC